VTPNKVALLMQGVSNKNAGLAPAAELRILTTFGLYVKPSFDPKLPIARNVWLAAVHQNMRCRGQ
jgi:hypothetical protein